MKPNSSLLLCIAALSWPDVVEAQTFKNLDFESALVPPIPEGEPGVFVPLDEALPGWTGYLGGIERTQVAHNGETFGNANISLFGPYWPVSGIIQGRYTAYLQAGELPSIPDLFVDASLSQIGLVPPDSHSLLVKIYGSFFSVSLGGTDLDLIQIGSGPNYRLYGADIAEFSGQTAELRLTTHTTTVLPYNSVYFDSIAFSPLTVPEPGTLGLLAVGGGLLFAFRILRSPRRK